MSKLPIVSGNDIIKALGKVGYVAVRQKGSYIRLKVNVASGRKSLTVPLHNTVKPGLLRHIIRDASLTVDEFIELL